MIALMWPLYTMIFTTAEVAVDEGEGCLDQIIIFSTDILGLHCFICQDLSTQDSIINLISCYRISKSARRLRLVEVNNIGSLLLLS